MDGVQQVMLGSTMTSMVSVFAVGLPLVPARRPGEQRRVRQAAAGQPASDNARMSAQVMLGSTLTKLVSVFAVGLPLCLLGGLAYSCASGKPLLDGCLQAYAALYKIPGTGLPHE